MKSSCTVEVHICDPLHDKSKILLSFNILPYRRDPGSHWKRNH